MRRVLSSRWHGVLSKRAVLLRIKGRRTGRRYDICVGYSAAGPDAIDVLVSDASNRTWWRNFDDGGPIGVVLRGQYRPGWATAHRAPGPEFKEIADRSLPRIVGRRGATRFFGLDDFDADTGLTDQQLELLAGFAVAVTIDLDPPQSPKDSRNSVESRE